MKYLLYIFYILCLNGCVKHEYNTEYGYIDIDTAKVKVWKDTKYYLLKTDPAHFQKLYKTIYVGNGKFIRKYIGIGWQPKSTYYFCPKDCTYYKYYEYKHNTKTHKYFIKYNPGIK